MCLGCCEPTRTGVIVQLQGKKSGSGGHVGAGVGSRGSWLGWSETRIEAI